VLFVAAGVPACRERIEVIGVAEGDDLGADAGGDAGTQADAGEPADAGAPDAGPLAYELVLWLRADRGVALDATGNVPVWADRSGEANDATQPDPAARPRLTTVGGLPFIAFDGLASHLAVDLASPSAFADFTPGFTAFVAARTEATTPSYAARFLDFAQAYGTLVDSILFVRFGAGDELLYQVYAGAVPGPYVDVPGIVTDGKLALYEVVAQGGPPLAFAQATEYLNGRALAEPEARVQERARACLDSVAKGIGIACF
jgi:hypothetical protein